MSKRTAQWPPIYKITNSSGLVSYQVDLRKVGGTRPKFATKPEAEARAEQARIEKDNGGTAIMMLPQDVKLDAVKAHKILSPHNVSILESAKYYEKHVLAYKNAPLVKDMIVKYVLDAKNSNLRPRSIEDLEDRLNKFADDFGDFKLFEITLDELKEIHLGNIFTRLGT